jgi:hypothetical protein
VTKDSEASSGPSGAVPADVRARLAAVTYLILPPSLGHSRRATIAHRNVAQALGPGLTENPNSPLGPDELGRLRVRVLRLALGAGYRSRVPRPSMASRTGEAGARDKALAALIPAGGIIGALAPSPSAKAPAKGAKADLRVVEKKAADKGASEKAARAKAALAEAESAVDTARDAAKRATTAQEKADADWNDAHQALQDARRVLDQAMDHEREAQHRRDAARREATQASHALDRAERARDAAERQYQAASE